MRVLFLSKLADGLGVADRLSQEGHDVRFWSQDHAYSRDLQGIISRVESFRPSVPWADLIICDMVGFSNHLDLFQRYAKPTLSCNAFGDIIELDRLRGLKTARAVGMSTPESWTFPNVAAALDHQIDRPVVVKPNDNQKAGETRICQTPELYKWALRQFDPSQEVLVQEVVSGIEISTEGWFNGNDWILPYNHTLEEKTLLSGGTLNTGCMGNLVYPCFDDRLFRETLLKMTPLLRKAGYRGPIDVNTICTKEHAYFLEFTARMGYDAVEALITGLKEPAGSFLFEVATGVKKEMALTEDYMIAVRICMPPYPFKGRADHGVPIGGVNPKNRKYLFLSGVQKTGDRITTSGSDGVVAKATATGRTPSEARSRVYRTVGNLRGVDLYYREDIGSRADRDMRQLKEWGWI